MLQNLFSFLKHPFRRRHIFVCCGVFRKKTRRMLRYIRRAMRFVSRPRGAGLDGHALLLKLLLGDEILDALLGAHQILDGHGFKAGSRSLDLHAVAAHEGVHLFLVALVGIEADGAYAHADQYALHQGIRVEIEHDFFFL